jgi:hypothetical protein
MHHTTETCDKRKVQSGTIRVETRLWVALIRYRHCTQPQEKNRHYCQLHHHYYYYTSGITRRCPGFKQVKYSLSVLASDCYPRYFLCWVVSSALDVAVVVLPFSKRYFLCWVFSAALASEFLVLFRSKRASRCWGVKEKEFLSSLFFPPGSE